MSIIDGFQKIWPFVSRYKRLVVSSFVLAVLVGVLWGANLSLVFPVSNVLMQGNLQDYVATQIQDASPRFRRKSR